jgi:hypothetical protein
LHYIILTRRNSVGKAQVASLLHPEASKNRALIINSFTAMPDEILAEFEKQTGGEKWDVSYTPLEDIKKFEEDSWAKGEPWATGFTLLRIWTEGGTLYDRPRDNESIGFGDTQTLADAVKKAIQLQS